MTLQYLGNESHIMRLESFGYTGGSTPAWSSRGHLETTAQGKVATPVTDQKSRGHVVSDQAFFPREYTKHRLKSTQSSVSETKP